MRPLFFYGWMVEICSINKIFVDLGCLVDSTPGGPSPSREERDREIGRERERERESQRVIGALLEKATGNT